MKRYNIAMCLLVTVVLGSILVTVLQPQPAEEILGVQKKYCSQQTRVDRDRAGPRGARDERP
jgi:hypothetical protein